MGASDTAAVNQQTRGYRSPRREEQVRHTRQRILAAAAAQFRARGYGGTTVRAVAADAGVAIPTVELAFGTKARLLKAVIDAATAGDDQPVPMLERPWAARARATKDATAFLAVFAQQLVDSARRAAGLAAAAFDAAPGDPDVALIAAQLAAQREVMAAWVVDGVARRASLRTGMSRHDAIDTVWVLMDPTMFCRLTRDRGWSAARFQRWFTDGLTRLLLAPADSTPAGGGQRCTGHAGQGVPARGGNEQRGCGGPP